MLYDYDDRNWKIKLMYKLHLNNNKVCIHVIGIGVANVAFTDKFKFL